MPKLPSAESSMLLWICVMILFCVIKSHKNGHKLNNCINFSVRLIFKYFSFVDIGRVAECRHILLDYLNKSEFWTIFHGSFYSQINKPKRIILVRALWNNYFTSALLCNCSKLQENLIMSTSNNYMLRTVPKHKVQWFLLFFLLCSAHLCKWDGETQS